jgi:hypothetical protein
MIAPRPGDYGETGITLTAAFFSMFFSSFRVL